MFNINTLEYNLPTYYINLPHIDSDVFVELIFPIGPLSIKTENPEVPHLIEHLLSSEIQKVGLTCLSSSNLKNISFTTAFPERDFNKKANLLLKTIFEYSFSDQDRFKIETNILLNETLDNISLPQEFCNRLAINSFFEDTIPYLTNEIETGNLNLNSLLNFFQSNCKPENALLFIGSANLNLPSPTPPTIPAPVIKFPLEKTSEIIEKKLQCKKTYINLSWPILNSQEDPKKQIALYIISELLINRDDGLLWQSLQEKNGLTYSIESHIDYYPSFGYFSLEFSVLPKDVEKALEIIKLEINNIKEGKINPKFFNRIIRENIRDTKKKWSENEGRFYWIMGDILDRGRIYTLREWLDLYSEINPEYVANIAKEYLVDASMHKTMVGS